MKVLIYLFLLSYTVYGHGQILTHGQCQKAAMEVGGINTVPVKCFDIISKHKKNIEIKKRNGDYQIIGWKNIIFIKEKFKDKDNKVIKEDLRILAGGATKITDVRDMVISRDFKWLYVLNKNNTESEVLAFKPDRNGNVKPRIIKTKKLKDARKIYLSQDNSELFVLSNNFMLIVDAYSNSRSEIDGYKPVTVNFIKNEKLYDATHFELSKYEVIVIFPSSKTVVAYSLQDGKEVWSLKDKDISLEKLATYFEYDDEKDRLRLFDPNGKTVEFDFAK